MWTPVFWTWIPSREISVGSRRYDTLPTAQCKHRAFVRRKYPMNIWKSPGQKNIVFDSLLKNLISNLIDFSHCYQLSSNMASPLTDAHSCIKHCCGISEQNALFENNRTTRMHSSRMRTVRCSGRPGVSAQEGCLARGVSAYGGVCLSVYWCWDTHTPRVDTPPGSDQGGCVSQHALRHTPLWTEFLTHACENITFPQLRCGR